MIRRRFLAWSGFIVFLIALAGIAYFYLHARDAKRAVDPSWARRDGLPIPVRTALVTQSDADEVIGATAVTVPSDTASIRIGPSKGINATAPLTDITVKAIHVQEGVQVQPGQLLFEIDAELFNEVVKYRQSGLEAANSELNRIKESLSHNEKLRQMDVGTANANRAFRLEDLENRTQAFEVMERLNQSNSVTVLEYYNARSKKSEAQFALNEAETQLQRAENARSLGTLTDKQSLAKASIAVEIAKIESETARRDAERTQIKSTLGGFVTKVDIIPGQVVSVNSTLTQILKLDPLHLRVDYPQERIDSLALGQKAEIVLSHAPSETFHGTVVRIMPQVNPDLQVLPVLVQMPNPNSRLKAGMSGFVRIRVPRTRTAVPATAVIQQSDQAVAYCVEEGRARLRQVRTGHVIENGLLEVRDGLAPGDEVVIFHNFYRQSAGVADIGGYLQHNDRVNTNWRKWARRE